MPLKEGLVYEFGEFRLDRISRQLWHREQPVHLTNKCFELLVLLVQSRGEVLSREHLLATLWSDTFIEEGNLTQTISILRNALGEGGREPQYIVTIPRRGYRFGPPVLEAEPASPTEGQPQDQRPHCIVVLPFVNLSSNPDNEYFSDGLTEEIINALAPISGLKVVARTSAFQFKDQNLDVRVIGSKVGADMVMEGSVRRQGDRVRITAQMNNARDGYHYWSRSWDRELKDIFEVQQEIANGVAQALGASEALFSQAVLPATQDMEAYTLYLRGLYLSNKMLVAEAVEVLEQAVKKDPAFAAAIAALAYQYSLLGYESRMRPREAYTIANSYAERALRLNPSLPGALFAQGWISTFYDWDWVAAERYLKRAIAGNQSTAGAHHAYAHFLVAMGQFPKALEESYLVLAEEPSSPGLNGHLAWHQLYCGRPDLAIPQALHALEIDSLLGSNLQYLRWAYEATGKFVEAIHTAGRHYSPDVTSRLSTEFDSHGEAGYWQAWLDYLVMQRKENFGSSYEIATIAARLGKNKEAVDWLQCAFDERDSWIVYVKVDPKLSSVRQEAGVNELITKLRLP